jgi:hypothetical protein
MNEITRKDFLKGVGKAVAGVAVVGTFGSALTGCSTPAATPAAKPVSAEKPQWPFPYKKIDPDKAAERAFKAYKEKGG